MLNSTTILVDMDNTIANWDATLKSYMDSNKLPWIDPNAWDVTKRGYDHITFSQIKQVINGPEFYASLQVSDGAVETLNNLHRIGFDVKLCTSPPEENPHAIYEKRDWVHTYLGKGWVDSIIFAHDKTIVNGKVLIDDKPCVYGIKFDPEWKHVLFDQPYNRGLIKPRILRWEITHVLNIILPFLN